MKGHKVAKVGVRFQIVYEGRRAEIYARGKKEKDERDNDCVG
jgi:hypothetical protein